jgi:polyhydroxybutyrate depolymerase
MRSAVIVVFLLAACGSEDGPRPLTFGTETRPVDLKAPATLTDGKEYPLVVVLHGYGATGFVQSSYFGVSMLPAMDKALVIAPDGTVDSTGKQFWNADAECCDFDNKNPDDVAYIGGIIDEVIDTWPVDKKAVYVIGHSNGGFMSYRMACERADVISAIAPLAGLAASDVTKCNPSRPVNVLHMHGTMDATVPYGPTTVVGSLGALGSVRQWATHNGCQTSRTAGGELDLETNLPGAETKKYTTDGCPAQGAVELWAIEGAGHIPIFGSAFLPAVMQWFTDHRRS